MDAADFLPFKGDLVVTGETSGDVTSVSWNGTDFVNETLTPRFPGPPGDNRRTASS